MSAPNFKFMLYNMPLVTGACSMPSYEESKKEYEEENGEPYSVEMYYGDCYFWQEIKAREAEELIEEIQDTLQFHDITIEGGRYYSFQFFVEEKYSGYFDLDKNSRYCIDNEDAHYYFDMCRSRALRAADAEKRKIRKWLEGLEKRGFDKLVCVAMFSNGEAIYERYNERTAMIAAAREVA